MTRSEWSEVIQDNYGAMQVYQYYLSKYFDLEASSSFSMDLKKILRSESLLYMAFIRELRTEVSTLEKPAV